MVQSHRLLKESPSQTAGPYVHIGCTPNFAEITGVYDADLGSSMKTGAVKGTEIEIVGQVFDGTGTPLRDAMVEIWQADADGLFNAAHETRGTADPNFTGWGRCPTGMDSGEFRFETIKPGRVPFVDGTLQAPHISVWIVARGINVGLHTRLYFDDEDTANEQDPILNRIEHANRKPTLIATKESDNRYRFDIVLQGENETIFFDM
ncbi:MAG: protocatechuate 3,4-dioxygenase subunit alpha [Sulfitobacter sp.]